MSNRFSKIIAEKIIIAWHRIQVKGIWNNFYWKNISLLASKKYFIKEWNPLKNNSWENFLTIRVTTFLVWRYWSESKVNNKIVRNFFSTIPKNIFVCGCLNLNLWKCLLFVFTTYENNYRSVVPKIIFLMFHESLFLQ